jgi:Mce-associated membrane protein
MSTSDEDLDEKAPSWIRERRPAVRVLVLAVLPALTFLLTAGTAWVKWEGAGYRDAQSATTESVRAATESTIALLSYQPDTVDKDLVAVRDRLTGAFRDSFTSLTNDVVIPGSKEQRIFSTATVPTAASVSAMGDHAVVLVFINQTTTVADGPPTATASSVKVTLDKVDGRWLISDFTPV